MSTVDFGRALVSKGYKARHTDVEYTRLYEYSEEMRRVVVITEHEAVFGNDTFLWFLSNLINEYGYSNVLLVAFTDNSFHTRTVMPTVQYWIYNNGTRRLEIYDDQPGHFYGVENDLENLKPAKKYNNFLNVNVIIVAVNIIVYILMEIIGDTESTMYLYQCGGKTPASVIQDTQYYRYVFSMFIHAGFSHIFNNMLLLFFVGDNLERAMGHIKYVILYFSSGLIAGIVSQVYYYMCGDLYVVCIGASGAIFGVLGALIWVLIRNNGRLENLSLPRIILYCVLSVGVYKEGVNVMAHIGGLVSGFLIAMLLYRRRGVCYEN